jgi:uncharacterized membrane protein
MIRLIRWLVLVVILSAGFHYAAVTLLPSVIMSRVMSTIDPSGKGTIKFGERPTAAARAIVRPSPDLLYSTCIFDVTNTAYRVVTAAPTDTYWSVAFYADNTDNFYVLNDHQANGKPATIMLIGKGQTLPPQPEGTIVISAPTNRGLVLFRTLINDDARLAEIDGQRRQSKCDQLLPSEMK